MPKTIVKYEIARNEPDNSEYYLQSIDFSTLSKPSATANFWHKVTQTLFLISVYFVLSIGLTFYQQWLFKSYGFNYPLGVVVCHLCVKYLMTVFVRAIRKCCKSYPEVNLAFRTVVKTVAAPGIASGLDVGFSNWAISLITMSLYTMTKSTTIIFILTFSLVFKLEKKSWSLVGIVVTISIGLSMFTYKSTQFDVFGFALCLFASLCAGLRWTMAQTILQKSTLGLQNPVDMMYYIQPWMLLSILPSTFWFEGGKIWTGFWETDWSDSSRVLTTIFVVTGGAVLAFNMEVMEFMVVTYTSSLTLSISGIIKEIFILILAVEWKGDEMSGMNFLGLLLCLGGITLHVIRKILVGHKHNREEVELQGKRSKAEESRDSNLAPLLTGNKSTSLSNLLNGGFSSDDDENNKDENSAQVLYNVVQRREKN